MKHHSLKLRCKVYRVYRQYNQFRIVLLASKWRWVGWRIKSLYIYTAQIKVNFWWPMNPLCSMQCKQYIFHLQQKYRLPFYCFKWNVFKMSFSKCLICCCKLKEIHRVFWVTSSHTFQIRYFRSIENTFWNMRDMEIIVFLVLVVVVRSIRKLMDESSYWSEVVLFALDLNIPLLYVYIGTVYAISIRRKLENKLFKREIFSMYTYLV